MHTLYRFYDHAGSLVGITNNPPRRFRKHRGEKTWWLDVADIRLEQFNSRDELAAAERRAIQNEKPLHNVRLNGASRSSKADPTIADGIVGRWFHSYEPLQDGEDPASFRVDRNGNKRVWQGQVVDREGALLVLQLYSWWDGCAAEQVIRSVEDMSSWRFYGSSQDMQTADGCEEDFGRGVRGGPQGRCGAPCTHVIRDGGMHGGPVYRCHRCIRFYGGKVEAL